MLTLTAVGMLQRLTTPSPWDFSMGNDQKDNDTALRGFTWRGATIGTRQVTFPYPRFGPKGARPWEIHPDTSFREPPDLWVMITRLEHPPIVVLSYVYHNVRFIFCSVRRGKSFWSHSGARSGGGTVYFDRRFDRQLRPRLVLVSGLPTNKDSQVVLPYSSRLLWDSDPPKTTPWIPFRHIAVQWEKPISRSTVFPKWGGKSPPLVSLPRPSALPVVSPMAPPSCRRGSGSRGPLRCMVTR